MANCCQASLGELVTGMDLSSPESGLGAGEALFWASQLLTNLLEGLGASPKGWQ